MVAILNTCTAEVGKAHLQHDFQIHFSWQKIIFSLEYPAILKLVINHITYEIYLHIISYVQSIKIRN